MMFNSYCQCNMFFVWCVVWRVLVKFVEVFVSCVSLFVFLRGEGSQVGWISISSILNSEHGEATRAGWLGRLPV
jgi:hypothetical protein